MFLILISSKVVNTTSSFGYTDFEWWKADIKEYT